VAHLFLYFFASFLSLHHLTPSFSFIYIFSTTGCFFLVSNRVEQLWQKTCDPQSLKYLLSNPLWKKFSDRWFRRKKAEDSKACLLGKGHQQNVVENIKWKRKRESNDGGWESLQKNREINEPLQDIQKSRTLKGVILGKCKARRRLKKRAAQADVEII